MPNTYVALATQTLGTAASTVTFSSISSGYTDLVLVINGTTGAGAAVLLQFNSDAASNYSNTGINGSGTAATSFRGTSGTSVGIGEIRTYNTTIITSIQNYSNTTTFKTLLSRANTASDFVQAIVGLWRNTAAINSITLSLTSSTFAVGSTFSLYGIANADQGAAKATGGIITEDSQYWYHTFGASGAFIPKQSLTCDILAVAGGGGGANFGQAAGGGAGGVVYLASQSVTATSYAVTVGAGGATGGGSNGSQASDGNASLVAGFTTAVGGGGGGSYDGANGRTGGSGGGGGGRSGGSGSGTGGSPTTGQGFAGGNGVTAGNEAGGGGGAGEAGNTDGQGAGGDGTAAYSSWGVATGIGQNVSGTYYLAGGGGGNATTTSGGLGGGGGLNTPGVLAGTANTGGGGGAWYMAGGAGGSGVVIVRYAK